MHGPRATARLGNVLIEYDKASFTRDGWDVVPARIAALRRGQVAAFHLPEFRGAVIALSADREGCAGVIVPGTAVGAGRDGPVLIRDGDRDDPGGLFEKIAEHIWERAVYS